MPLPVDEGDTNVLAVLSALDDGVISIVIDDAIDDIIDGVINDVIVIVIDIAVDCGTDGDGIAKSNMAIINMLISYIVIYLPFSAITVNV